MARGSLRIMALAIAAIFLVSSLALSIAVLVQSRQESQQLDTEELDLSEQQIEELLESQEATEPQEGALQGTILQGFEPTGEVNELQTIDLQEGDGATATAGSTVTAHYTGAYAVNGLIFESSKDSGQPATFPLNQVIQGWQEGVPGMKVGGIRRLVIPGPLAYGAAPEGYTPGEGGRPLGTLVFDIELIAIE